MTDTFYIMAEYKDRKLTRDFAKSILKAASGEAVGEDNTDSLQKNRCVLSIKTSNGITYEVKLITREINGTTHMALAVNQFYLTSHTVGMEHVNDIYADIKKKALSIAEKTAPFRLYADWMDYISKRLALGDAGKSLFWITYINPAEANQIDISALKKAHGVLPKLSIMRFSNGGIMLVTGETPFEVNDEETNRILKLLKK